VKKIPKPLTRVQPIKGSQGVLWLGPGRNHPSNRIEQCIATAWQPPSAPSAAPSTSPYSKV